MVEFSHCRNYSIVGKGCRSDDPRKQFNYYPVLKVINCMHNRIDVPTIPQHASFLDESLAILDSPILPLRPNPLDEGGFCRQICESVVGAMPATFKRQTMYIFWRNNNAVQRRQDYSLTFCTENTVPPPQCCFAARSVMYSRNGFNTKSRMEILSFFSHLPSA